MNRSSALSFAAALSVAAAAAPGLGCDKARQAGSDPASESHRASDTVPRPWGDPRLPGVARVDASLQRRLDHTLASKGPAHTPRTRHVDEDGSPRFTNRLIEESSPYLLQHAHNPVNWYPWSDAAFERARVENKPIFLSVGYSTCHWCHVMERESFEDEAIAAFLNRHFIAIKVDREERPDIDSVYMAVVSLLTGRGGWPMTVIMTPDEDPFFAGTYLPPRKGVRGSGAGLIDILPEIVRAYTQEPQRVISHAQEISQRVQRMSATQPGPGVPRDDLIVLAAQRLATTFDRSHGGFGGAPKFPEPSRLLLLMRYARRTSDARAISMVTTTLDEMAAGGIYDHIGGGFHRYATDAQWLIPHFEKMLYDNAQLAVVYLEAGQLTGDRAYQRVVRQILDYVAREMTSPEGGFHSATDADSPSPSGREEEGWFFTWSRRELVERLGVEESAIVSAVYGVSDQGNFEGRNVLHRTKRNGEVAAELGVSPTRVATVLTKARSILYDARASRPRPLVDEKIITAWNGLMISAFARAGWQLADDRYVEIAERAGRFVFEQMRAKDGALVRAYRHGKKSSPSFLNDYAFMVAACLDLYETTGTAVWLERALRLQAKQDAGYLDGQDGGYYLTPNDGERLLVRDKPTYDGAVPSGNSVSAENLLRLHDFTGDVQFRKTAEDLFAWLSLRVARSPIDYPRLLTALDRYYDAPLEIAIIGPRARKEADALARRLRTTFVPNKAFAVLTEAEATEQQAQIPWLDGKKALRGRRTAYVCERGRCDLPTSEPGVFQAQIDRRAPYPSFAQTPPPQLSFDPMVP